MRLFLLAAVSAVALSTILPAAALAADPPTKAMYGDWGVDLTAGDKSVSPGTDFDKYANGAWAARTQIPDDQASAGVGYDVYNRSQDQLRTLIETDEPSTQIGALYKSFIDEAKVEAVDDKPLKADLARIAAIKTKADFAVAMALRVNDYLSGLFSGVGITLVDFKIEFGRVYEGDFSRVILADEISPDSCRLWDSATNEKMDKDRFRRDLGNVIESYTEVARRLGIMKEMPTVIQGGVH